MIGQGAESHLQLHDACAVVTTILKPKDNGIIVAEWRRFAWMDGDGVSLVVSRP